MAAPAGLPAMRRRPGGEPSGGCSGSRATMGGMSEIPRNAARRTARLASLPLGAASRSAIGLSRRARGESAESVNEDLRRRTAEQLFTVLGSLKGGAMKVGQTLSVLEAAMPEDLVQPYREMLVQLQDAAPPMSYSTVTDILDRELGSGWERTMVRDLSERPVAAASIGSAAAIASTTARCWLVCSPRNSSTPRRR